MEYHMRAGVLYNGTGDRSLASIRTVFHSQEKKIFGPDGKLLARTTIRQRLGLSGAENGVEKREYVLYGQQEEECAVAHPAYCDQDAPERTGWPVCHTPLADHAQLLLKGQKGLLKMCDGAHYTLCGADGRLLLQLTHRGMLGGWDLRGPEGFSAEFLCGLFVFCRYLEKENEMLYV